MTLICIENNLTTENKNEDIALYYLTLPKEIEYLYDILYLGNYSINKRGIFDKLADKLFYKDKCFNKQKNVREIALNIIDVCKKHSIQEICFVGKTNDEVKECINNVADILQEDGIKVIFLENNHFVEVLSQNVIYVEKLRETTVQEVKDKIKFCREQNLNICGYVTFSK